MKRCGADRVLHTQTLTASLVFISMWTSGMIFRSIKHSQFPTQGNFVSLLFSCCEMALRSIWIRLKVLIAQLDSVPKKGQEWSSVWTKHSQNDASCRTASCLLPIMILPSLHLHIQGMGISEGGTGVIQASDSFTSHLECFYMLGHYFFIS